MTSFQLIFLPFCNRSSDHVGGKVSHAPGVSGADDHATDNPGDSDQELDKCRRPLSDCHAHGLDVVLQRRRKKKTERGAISSSSPSCSPEGSVCLL
jgi:hypothetical protein